MLKRAISILMLGLVCNFAIAQTKLVETVKQKGDEIIIPYQKYVLENGLTLIIHEDKSDPLVHVDVTYHVGSAREELKKSGFAHFFEHMMFQGSENVGDEEHFKYVSESGGTLNGTTNRDRTNYFETLPSNQLETALWLEADRMGFLLPAVTQKKFEVQRSTVKNEKGQNYDNSPYGRWREMVASAMYPYGHPYSWLTIGQLEDLDRVDVTDLKKFFLRWYGPNNATVTVGGDVDTQEVIKLVEKYFGSIPRGQEVKNMKLDLPTLDKDRYVSYVDKNIRFPALLVSFPTVPQFHEDEAALECLAQIIGTGRSSYFYKQFVSTRKAIQASVFNINSELAGEMTMFVLPYPGTPLTEFDSAMRQALVDFETSGVKDEDIIKFRSQYESQTINSLQSVSRKVGQLAAFQTYTGNPNQIGSQIQARLDVTKEDVMRVYAKYIKGKPSVRLSVLAEGMEGQGAKEDNFKPQTEGKNPFPTTDYSGLTYTHPKDDFDRSKKPVAGQAPLVSVPEFWTKDFKNGMKLIGSQTKELPLVSFRIRLEGGHILDAHNPKKAGLASLTAAMLNESNQKYTAEEMSEELLKLGSNISVFGGTSETIVNVQSLKKNLPQTMALLEQRLLNPKFTKEDFDRVKQQQIEGIKSGEKQPTSIANTVYNRLLYGQNHIMSVPVSGIEETVTAIELKDIEDFYTKYYSPSISELVVVGDISEKEVMKNIEFLKAWKKKAVKMPSLPKIPSVKETKVYLVDKEKAPQSEIRIGYMTDLKYDVTGEYFKSSLMNYTLGGAFNSRINLNLREDKGFTYGARSGFSNNADMVSYTARAGVRANVSDSSVVEFMKEITNYHKDGITKDELDFMRKSIGQRDARQYETLGQKASFLGRIVEYGLDKSYVKKQNEIINTISQEDLNALAKKYLGPDKMNILVVGDKAEIGDKLKALGYPVIYLNAKGDVIEGGLSEEGKKD
jgi:zinc protease